MPTESTTTPSVRFRSPEETAARRQQGQPNCGDPAQSPVKVLLHILGNPESVAALRGAAAGKVPELWGEGARNAAFVALVLAEARLPGIFNPDPNILIATMQGQGWRLTLPSWGAPQAGDVFVRLGADGPLLGFVRRINARLTGEGTVYAGTFRGVVYEGDGEADFFLEGERHYWLRYG